MFGTLLLVFLILFCKYRGRGQAALVRVTPVHLAVLESWCRGRPIAPVGSTIVMLFKSRAQSLDPSAATSASSILMSCYARGLTSLLTGKTNQEALLVARTRMEIAAFSLFRPEHKESPVLVVLGTEALHGVVRLRGLLLRRGGRGRGGSWLTAVAR